MARHLPQVVGGDTVDGCIEGRDIPLLAVMQETLAKTQGKTLAVVAGYAYLAFQLSLGSRQLGGGERLAMSLSSSRRTSRRQRSTSAGSHPK